MEGTGRSTELKSRERKKKKTQNKNIQKKSVAKISYYSFQNLPASDRVCTNQTNTTTLYLRTWYITPRAHGERKHIARHTCSFFLLLLHFSCFSVSSTPTRASFIVENRDTHAHTHTHMGPVADQKAKKQSAQTPPPKRISQKRASNVSSLDKLCSSVLTTPYVLSPQIRIFFFFLDSSPSLVSGSAQIHVQVEKLGTSQHVHPSTPHGVPR